jgi:hypothetical protein
VSHISLFCLNRLTNRLKDYDMQVKYRKYIDERVSAYVPARLEIIQLIWTARQTLLNLQDIQTYRTEFRSEGGIREFVEHCLTVSYVP